MNNREIELLHEVAEALLDEDIGTAKMLLADVLEFCVVEDYVKTRDAQAAIAAYVH